LTVFHGRAVWLGTCEESMSFSVNKESGCGTAAEIAGLIMNIGGETEGFWQRSVSGAGRPSWIRLSGAAAFGWPFAGTLQRPGKKEAITRAAHKGRAGRLKSNFVLILGRLLVFCWWVWPLLAGMPARGADRQWLRGHVPSVVARLRPLGLLPATNQLRLAIGLPLRNHQALLDLLDEIYDPSSPRYHQYLTPEQFTARFGPTEQDYEAVENFARRNGFAIRGTHPNRMLLDVSAPASDIERAFQVTMRTYQHPNEARAFYAADAEPSVEAGLPILDITGLSDYMPPRRTGGKATRPTGTSGPEPEFATGPTGLYSASDIRKACVPGVTNTGAGQVVGLLEQGAYAPGSIYAYENWNGLPNVPLTNVLVDGAGGVPIVTTVEEVTADIELVIAMAPGLSQVIVYESPSGSAYANDLLNRMATDNLASQISSSWAWGGGPNAATDQMFQQFAAQGQSYFNGSGDSGADGRSPLPGGGFSGTNDAPLLTSPYITLVGGTTLSTGPDGAWVSETVANWGNGASSGGGISTTYPIPAWQQGISMSANGGSSTMRNSPDVAIVATGLFVEMTNPETGLNSIESFSGTSASTPLWAAFTALVNQQAAANGQPPVGFLNPALYAIANSPAYTSCFHDITTGNNVNSYVTNAFFAVPGYDLCTGLGSPAGQSLINALAPGALGIVPGTGLLAGGVVGGPFTVASQNLWLTNSGTTPLTWALGNSSDWLTASPASGTLYPGGAGAAVAISLSPGASNLGVGVHTATLWFTNQNNGIWQSRLCALSITSAPNATSSAVLSLGPVGYWQLNETNPPPRASVAANAGLLGPAATGFALTGVVAGEPGVVGTAFRFSNPGVEVNYFGSHLDIPYNPALNPGGAFSIELWAMPAQPTSDLFSPACSVDCTQNGGNSRLGWVVYQTAAGWQFSLGGLDGYVATLAGGAYQTNVWHHLVGVYDGVNATLYLNGQVIAGPRRVNGFAPNTNCRVPLRLGAATLANRTYDGWVDEAAFYTNALSAADVAAHYSAATTNNSGYAAQILADNPVGYWHLDEPSYSAPAQDALPVAVNIGSLSAAANGIYEPGSLPGAAGVPDAGLGADNRACQFNNTGWIAIPAAWVGFTGPLTLSAWVKANPAAGCSETIVGKGAGSYELSLDGSGLPHFSDGMQPVGDLVGPSRIDDGQWHQLAGMYDGTNSEYLYVDGQLVASTSGATAAVGGDSYDLAIGGDPNAFPFQPFNGVVDEVALFTNALTAAQVSRVFSAAFAAPPAAPVLLAQGSAGGVLAFSWSAIPGRTYQLQYKADLSQSDWISLGGTVTATQDHAGAADTIGPDQRRFYRVVLLP
jgi:hypothetical protein